MAIHIYKAGWLCNTGRKTHSQEVFVACASLRGSTPLTGKPAFTPTSLRQECWLFWILAAEAPNAYVRSVAYASRILDDSSVGKPYHLLAFSR